MAESVPKLTISERFEQWIDIFKKLRIYRHSDYGILLVSIVLGIGVGLAIVVFHTAMHLSESFFREVFTSADKFSHLGRLAIPLITAFGGLCVGLLSTRVFFRAHGEGLHMLADAIKHKSGVMHWISAVKAIVNAALSIGSGGGGGKEGPVILLGSSVGSTLGQLAGLRPEALKTLCAAGAAAAISGIFNAPLAGLVFAVEAIYGEFMLSSFISVIVASVMSTAVTRALLGNTPVIIFPSTFTITLTDYIYIGIGGIMSGLISVYYLKIYHAIHIQFMRFLGNKSPIIRTTIGGLLAGILLTLLPTMLETTYKPISNVIAGEYSLFIVIATFLIKPISNAVTLSSGGSGGTFAPVLKAGAMWGFFFGTMAQYLTPAISPSLFAVMGAGAMLAGTWRMPLTGAILLCESTHNYDILLPMLFSSIIAVFIVERFKNIQSFNPIETKE